MAFTNEQTLIQVDIDPACIGRVFPVQVGMAADVLATVQALLRRCATDPDVRASWRDRIGQHRQAEHDEIDDVAWDAAPIISPRVVRELRAAMAPDAVLAVDSGNFNYWVQRYFEARTPGAYIYPAATGTMGCGLPAAMGVKVAFPDRQVVAVAGDGGFLMTMQDLETCVREKINVVCVVMNNFSYGNIKIRQQTVFGNRLIGCEFGNPDFAATAKLFGAHGERVSKPGELGPALQRALSANKPAVVDVLVDPAEICTATVRPWWKG
jgi:acetolactate synthase-1/2/3 large subunit